MQYTTDETELPPSLLAVLDTLAETEYSMQDLNEGDVVAEKFKEAPTVGAQVKSVGAFSLMSTVSPTGYP